MDQSYHDCVTRGNKSCTIVLCIRNLRTKKKLLLQQQYFNNTLDWKKKICSVCTTCFCSGCGFGRVDAFLIQGYLRETYLPIGGPKLYKFKGSKTLVVSLQDNFSKIGFFWIWELLPRVSFSSCQRNLIKTFQIEAMIALITKMVLIFSWDLLNGQK